MKPLEDINMANKRKYKDPVLMRFWTDRHLRDGYKAKCEAEGNRKGKKVTPSSKLNSYIRESLKDETWED